MRIRDLFEAEQFKKEIDFFGLPIKIQILKGDKKTGKNKFTGEPWEKTMAAHYGFIDGVKGSDGEFLDCFIGPDAHNEANNVYIVTQMTPDGKRFDEQKIMLGFQSIDQAKQAYLDSCHTEKCFGGIKEMKLEPFKDLIYKKIGSKPYIIKKTPGRAVLTR